MPELDSRAAGGKRLKDKVCIVAGAGQGIGRAAGRNAWLPKAPRSS